MNIFVLNDVIVHIVTEFAIEQYLLNVKNGKLREQLTQFRLSAHNLAIYFKILIYQIETEFHVLLIWPKYIELRK